MKPTLTVGLLMSAALVAGAGSASAQRWGREAVPRTGACFYQDINFQGNYFCSPAGAATVMVPENMNDKISSIRVFGNAMVTVYRDANFRGQSSVIGSGNMPDLRQIGFNDRLSSYRVDVGNYGNGGYGNNYPNGTYGNNYPNNYPNGTYGTAVPRGEVINRRGEVVGGQPRMNRRAAESMVRQSYRNVLGRDADVEGLRSWTDQVQANNWTERDLEQAMRHSDEFRTLRENRRR